MLDRYEIKIIFYIMQKRGKIALLIVIIAGASIPFWISPVIESIQYDYRYGDGVIKANLCDVDKVANVSKFRSCAGHPYPLQGYGPGGQVSTSSEKHYIRLKNQYFDDPVINVALYAIWDGTIESIVKDESPAIGYQIILSSAGWTAIYMHVNNLSTLNVGQRVAAGDQIGFCDAPYPGGSPYTAFDICIHHHKEFSAPGYSYFEMLSDALFEPWQARGATKTALVITADYRAQNPCQTGCTNNSLCYNQDPANWVNLT
jgi:hypothetical protein